MVPRLCVLFSAVAATSVIVACGKTHERESASSTGVASMSLAVSSSAFAQNADIPAKYTCEGQDVSPPLSWSGAPSTAKSFAVIVDDPDAPDPAAPKMTYVHWVLYDIPASVTSLDENVAKQLPSGAQQGMNDGKRTGYGGPCPPIGRHRYFFKVYALDTTLGDIGSPSKAALESAMKGHVVAQGELVSTYQKKK
jgi:Raf kinase inhibitor-like YbhB/YbcL family protein